MWRFTWSASQRKKTDKGDALFSLSNATKLATDINLSTGSNIAKETLLDYIPLPKM